MTELHKFIWIVDAEKEFDRSREWFLKQVKLGKLHKVGISGDRKVYLVRSEIVELLQPRIYEV